MPIAKQAEIIVQILLDLRALASQVDHIEIIGLFQEIAIILGDLLETRVATKIGSTGADALTAGFHRIETVSAPLRMMQSKMKI